MIRHLLTALLALAVVAPAVADDAKKAETKPAAKAKKGERKKGERARKAQPNPAARFFSYPKSIELSDAQKAELESLKKEYLPKLQALQQKQKEALPADYLKQRMEAMKKAKAEGKSGKELREAVEAAAKLSETEQAAIAEVREQMGPLMKEIRGKMRDILTEEQQQKLRGNRPERKRPQGKKTAKTEDTK